MSTLEKAEKYAEGKVNEIITKAITQAYIDGYREGYKDREETIMDMCNNEAEYVDLGLPSGTLWAKDYENLDGERLYLPYGRAKGLKLPTEEQWKELGKYCQWNYEMTDGYDSFKAICVGPNGNVLTFKSTGYMFSEMEWNEDKGMAFFWIKSDCDSKSTKNAVRFFRNASHIEEFFSGYKLPVRLVR